MAVPLGYSRNVLRGTLPNGEIWQVGLWAAEAPSDQAATQSQADSFAADVTAAKSNAGSPITFLPSSASLDEITVYSYTTASGKAEFVATSKLSLAGTIGAQPTMPNQVACCVTLETGHAGRRNRGRIFTPMLGGVTLTNGQLVAATCTPIATWWAALITTWNGHLAGNGICVLSQAAGTSNPVVSVRVDSRLDIQRRRADREAVLSQATATV